MDGWVCLHRKLVDWEWYTEHNTFRLFIYLLLSANHKDKKYRGDVIEKGCLATSYELLANGTGLSVQNVRTALNNLKSTGEITQKSSRKGTIIQIVNWSEYQNSNSKSTHELTDSQQTANKQLTTNNNDNNITKENINITREDHFVQLTAIGLDWIPDSEAIDYCKSLDLDFNRQHQKFINHYAGAGKKNHNWNFKFRAWCDEAFERMKEKKRNNSKDDDPLRGVRWK